MRFSTLCVRLGVPIATMGALLLGGQTHAESAPPHVPGRILVQFHRAATAEEVRNLVAAANAQDAGEIPHTGVHILQLPPQASEVAMARAFAQRPDVNFAELDVILRPAQTNTITPNDSLYPNQWHLPKISTPTAWATTTGSSSVIIAIVDTGCDPTHPDLASKYVAGWNLYDNNSNTADVYNHGTTVAGAAAAASNNGSGVASVAWNCMIMPVRISDTTGFASYSMAANGITYAANHGARVANLSYGMSDSSTVASAAQYLQSKGGVLTIAAGNNATNDTAADNPYALTVSATDSNDILATWSNYGNNIDVAAPGVNLTLPLNGGGYGNGSGTSFSAPLVAGEVALVMSANPGLTPSQVQNIIKTSADLVGGATGWTPQYGWGRINAARAIAAATNNPVNQPPTVATPAGVSTNPVTGTNVNLSVLGADDGGEANLTYTWSATGPAAVSYSANGTNAAKSTTATFSAAGTYTFTVTITDTGGLSTTSSVGLTVVQTATSLTVSPGNSSVVVNSTKQFAGNVLDQFGIALATQPPCTWSVSGGGAIDATGLFTALTIGGPFTVTASAVVSGTASVTVTAPPDTTPPTVSITSPTNGAKVSGTITVQASASDNVGVTKVELWVDGKLSSTDSTSPYSFSVNTKGWKTGSSHTLVCKAYDAAGNVGTSATVTVSK